MKTDSSLGEWTRALWRVCHMWIRGWSVLGRTLLAYLIVAVFSAPLSWFVTFLLRSSEPLGPVALFLLVAGFLFYLPLVFYVAGSWVGFCPYVTAEDDSMPVAEPADGK